MKWNKIEITNDNGEQIIAQAPIIISASRSTDIPAFYSDWFINRWKSGYIKWKNPFNGVDIYVTLKKARVVVFWTKNPKPIFKHIDFLKEKIKNFYFQFTLNDYDHEGFEGNVPSLKSRIETFKELSNIIGKKHVVWRFDPLFLTNQLSVKNLLQRIENIGDQLNGYTNKLVFSFADISMYRKVVNNLKRENIDYIEFTPETMIEFAEGINKLNKKWNLQIATCAEKFDLEKYNIKHNKCIDDELMIELFSHDKQLMNFLGYNTEQSLFDNNNDEKSKNNLKDIGQRIACGCILSKDIGQYNTCPHNCVYCYANTSNNIAKRNFNKHNPTNESIIGEE